MSSPQRDVKTDDRQSRQDSRQEPVARRVEKSASAFRTISEVAQDLDVPQHVLRFWETKFPQVRPLKRGGGRRYYRPEDIELLRGIRSLLYQEGYTIKGVQRLMRQGALKERSEAVEASDSGEHTEAESRPAAASGTRAAAPQRDELEAVLNELTALRDRLRAVLE
ncbi:MerR family transcriptional regulator [Rhodospirillaceae bacterium SYSU D60014]|uniref:MerR family transcriptional regulator n=1 Tax=Virgifigura deserti TaxID=2268457 RepID=UPI000E66FD44